MAFFDDETSRAWRSMPPLWKTTATTTTTFTGETAGSEQNSSRQPEDARGQSQQYADTDAMDALETANRLLTNSLERERDEFASYRRRVEDDHEKDVAEGKAEFLKTLLPALDDLERVRMNEPLTATMEAVVRKLGAALDKIGAVETIADPGEPFDPETMHAIAVVPTIEYDSEVVGEMAAAGWSISGKVIRPIQVVVAQPVVG